MFRIVLIALTLITGGCGAEVASTAAISGAVKAQEAKQAQQDLQRFRQKLDSANQAGQERAAEAEKNTGY